MIKNEKKERMKQTAFDIRGSQLLLWRLFTERSVRRSCFFFQNETETVKVNGDSFEIHIKETGLCFL